MNTQLVKETDQWLDMIEPGASRKELAAHCLTLDETLVKELITQGYYTDKGDLSEPALNKLKSDLRIETIYEKLDKAKTKQNKSAPWKAIDNWLENARKIMCDFLDEYTVGYLDEMYIDECGIVHADISCAMGDNHDGRWLEQKKKLKEAGIEVTDRKFSSRCYLEATGNNMEKVVALFKRKHDHVDVNINVRFGEIEAIKLEMGAEAIEAFKINTAAPTPENPSEWGISEILTEQETQNLRNEINSFRRAVHFLHAADIDKVLACQNLEVSFSVISHMLKAETKISGIIAKRYAAEKAAAKEYYELIKDIGNTFNPSDTREVVVRMVRDMEYYIHDKIGLNVKDIKIYPSHYGFTWAQLKYAVPRSYRKSQLQPRPQDDISQWDIHPETKHLLCTDRNRKKILDFCQEHNIGILYINTAYNTIVQDFIIQTIDIQIYDLFKILYK